MIYSLILMYLGSCRTSISFLFTVYICNSDFSPQKSEMRTFQNLQLGFSKQKSVSCSISKLANRIFTAKIRVRCISEFTTGIQFYPAKILVLCISKFATRIFTAKTRVANFDLNQTDFSAENSC